MQKIQQTLSNMPATTEPAKPRLALRRMALLRIDHLTLEQFTIQQLNAGVKHVFAGAEIIATGWQDVDFLAVLLILDGGSLAEVDTGNPLPELPMAFAQDVIEYARRR